MQPFYRSLSERFPEHLLHLIFLVLLFAESPWESYILTSLKTFESHHKVENLKTWNLSLIYPNKKRLALKMAQLAVISRNSPNLH